ncbi:2-dehydro-3-deoxygalactonokinase [Uliginosibacterium sp. H1]|uniref:2-dehydro-3-deoxygalactonokinase n=1 Tax=Uliginosibacterium sp. H1 TaxID=3114757 RepID=UPI002E18CE0D|nr:2-dehydro-3-deoxygalactonokinase [Uliginosibacterium sp. H1]
MRNSDTHWLAIDWGTTHRRAYLLDDGGTVVERQADDQGLLPSQGRFAESLGTLLAHWPQLGERPDVLMAGMVGSRSGWVEAPYLPAPVALGAIGQHLVEVPFEAARVRIVPGVCDDQGPDVMRGEETQILGVHALGGGDGCYLLPGTHSKWVWVEDGRITRLHTFMTGELFALLRGAGTLAGVLQAAEDAQDAAPAEAEGFEAGLSVAAQGHALSRALFSLRAGILRERLPATQGKGWLSGLLIGSEWHDPELRAQLAGGRVNIVGDARLAALHGRAAARLGVATRVFDPDEVFVAAMRALRSLAGRLT